MIPCFLVFVKGSNGKKSSQIFLIFIIEVDIISIFSIKGKTNVINWRVGLFIDVVSLLRRSRKAPDKTRVKKQTISLECT